MAQPTTSRTRKTKPTPLKRAKSGRESLFRREPALVIFSGVYLAAAAVAVILTGNKEFAFYLIPLTVIIAGTLWLDRRIRFSSIVLWCLSIWAAMHLAGGLVPLPAGWPYNGDVAVLYSAWIIPDVLKFDNIVHAFGFGTTAVAALQAMRPVEQRKLHPTLGQMTAAILVACGLGSVNEIVEFAATIIAPKTNVGGYFNTALDLVANLVGGTIAMLLVRFLRL
jgi:uncharacterized membrane protein YjdF